MIYQIGIVLFYIVAFLLIFFVLIQRSHGGFFSGPSSTDSTIVFGGSGGIEFLQKITWILGFLLIFLTFSLSLYKTKMAKVSKYSKYASKKDQNSSKNELSSDSNINGNEEDENSKKEVPQKID